MIKTKTVKAGTIIKVTAKTHPTIKITVADIASGFIYLTRGMTKLKYTEKTNFWIGHARFTILKITGKSATIRIKSSTDFQIR